MQTDWRKNLRGPAAHDFRASKRGATKGIADVYCAAQLDCEAPVANHCLDFSVPEKGFSKPLAALALSIVLTLTPNSRAANDVAGSLILFNDNGAWSWFEDERAIVDVAAGKIIVSSVADSSGTGGAARDGDVEVATLDIASGAVTRFTLSDNLQADDHNSAALFIRPDGRYLAMYSKHGSDQLTRYRISVNSGDASSWTAEQTFNNGIGTTYSNLHRMSAEAGRLYNFTRTVGFDPNVLTSTNNGQTWTYGGRLLDWPTPTGDPKFTGSDGSRPYLKYASSGIDEIHFITTEDHPRAYDNSIYHGVIRGGKVYDSFGNQIDGNLFDGSAASPNGYTPVFDTDASPLAHAWTTDLQLDAAGRPYALFTARAGLTNTNDHRLLYGRFDGAQWNVYEVAKMGGFLYASENDYTGLGALDPSNPDRVFISTKVDPRNDAALARYEIFEGVTSDGGANWNWSPITANSTMDNLRPIVPKWDSEHTALLWMRGTYSTYTNYNLDIVGLTEITELTVYDAGDLNRDRLVNLDDFALYMSGLHVDLSGMTAEEAQMLGDMNGDFANDYADFVLFRDAYDAAHAFARAVQAPEPGGASTMAIGGFGAWLARRWLAYNVSLVVS
jgi:hypothetical protein